MGSYWTWSTRWFIIRLILWYCEDRPGQSYFALFSHAKSQQSMQNCKLFWRDDTQTTSLKNSFFVNMVISWLCYKIQKKKRIKNQSPKTNLWFLWEFDAKDSPVNVWINTQRAKIKKNIKQFYKKSLSLFPLTLTERIRVCSSRQHADTFCFNKEVSNESVTWSGKEG